MTLVIPIIQVRTDSSRLPGKCFLQLGNKTLVENVIDRILATPFGSDLVVATTNRRVDDLLALQSALRTNVFRGDYLDVRSRFIEIAENSRADHIIRITADNPLVHPVEIEELVDQHLGNRRQYTTNKFSKGLVKGMDIEIISTEALTRSAISATSEHDKEHVTPHFYSSKVRIPPTKGASISIDTIHEYLFVAQNWANFVEQPTPRLLAESVRQASLAHVFGKELDRNA